jgi:hypothetical protein
MLDKIFYVANNLYTFKITTVHFITCLKNRYMIHSCCEAIFPTPEYLGTLCCILFESIALEFDQYPAMWRTWPYN